ncbi:MAG: lactone hydrolase [Acidocella sp. 20-57-95]|nr:MAG: lactone hydrolase [Acidocella sp. 20-57-95]OYV60382.1 MAG: lactone hydrolase [Acidocella sp. 21-58-7]HQT64811.1 alpha/beta hydrolase [Acidocella sp.]
MSLHKFASDWQTCTVRDGSELAYRLISGTGKARYALVHSLAMGGDFWNLVVPYLQKSGEVLVYDCRGHGKSSKPPGPYTGALFADDLKDLLDHIGWPSAIIAGASMGGCVSLAFASAYPRATAGLGLIDTTCWYGADAPAQWEDRAQKALTNGLAVLVDFQKTRWVSDQFRTEHADIVDAAIKVFMANDVAAYAEACRFLGRFDGRSALASLTMPTTILVGEEDYAAPIAMAEYMHKHIPHSEFMIISGARHLTPLECPQLIANKLIELAAKAW